MRYERAYGSIKLPQQEPRTIAPFGNNKGEAWASPFSVDLSLFRYNVIP